MEKTCKRQRTISFEQINVRHDLSEGAKAELFRCRHWVNWICPVFTWTHLVWHKTNKCRQTHEKKKYNCMNYFILGWIWFVFYNEPTVKRQHQTTLFKRHPLYTFAEKDQTCLNVLYVLLNPTHCTFK